MKKLVICLGLLLACSSGAFANNCEYTCVEPYNMNSKVGTFFSKITGLNFTATKIGENIIKKSLSKNIQSPFKIDLQSYSAKDLKNGIFKSLLISGSDVNIDGIHLSEFELKTLCDFNYIEYDKKGNLVFKEDFPMSFNIQMNANDINQTMKSERYQKILSDANKLNFVGIKISSTEVAIRGNKFYYIIKIALPFMKERKIEITADINVKDGEIDFENTRLASNSFKFDLKRIDFLINYLNPLDFSVNIFDNKNAKVGIKNISIKNNVIITDGIVVIPKD